MRRLRMFLARQRRRGTPCSLKLPNGKNVPFDPEGAVHFGECGGAVLFKGRGAGGYWFIPPGVAGVGWLLWHWPWSEWDERPVAEGGDGPWEIQGSLVATAISGVAVGVGRCRCRVRVLCSCDLLRVPFSWGARRGVIGTVRLFGGEFRLPRTVRSDQPFDGRASRARWSGKKNAKRRGDT